MISEKVGSLLGWAAILYKPSQASTVGHSLPERRIGHSDSGIHSESGESEIGRLEGGYRSEEAAKWNQFGNADTISPKVLAHATDIALRE